MHSLETISHLNRASKAQATRFVEITPNLFFRNQGYLVSVNETPTDAGLGKNLIDITLEGERISKGERIQKFLIFTRGTAKAIHCEVAEVLAFLKNLGVPTPAKFLSRIYGTA